MTDSIYSAAECEEKIRGIDADIEQIRKVGNNQMLGPIQINYAGRIKDLQAERAVWRRRLTRAKRAAAGEGRVGVNGPKSTI